MTLFEQCFALFLLYILVIAVGPFILFNTMKYDKVTVKEQFPIKYPIEPAEDNYLDILQDIENCKTDTDLKVAYVRIIIFEGTYKNKAAMVHNIYQAYHAKEREIEEPYI